MAVRLSRGGDYTRADEELARWLCGQGHPCSAARVRGWRRAGLLPEPQALAERRTGQPGRLSAAWTSNQLSDVRSLALRLVTVTGRGKSTTHAALRLAGEGLTVPAETVLTAAREHVATLQRTAYRALGSAGPAILGATDPEDRRDQLDAYAHSRPGLVRLISQRLGNPTKRDGEPDALSVFSLLLQAAAGLPPDPTDVDTIELTLQTLGIHGLLEPVGGPDGPRVLTDGAGEAAQAISLLDVDRLSSLIAGIDPQTVHPTLRATRQLGQALTAVPSEIRHNVAADLLAPMLLDDDPTAVVLRLVCFQALRRDRGVEPDVSPILLAVQLRSSVEDDGRLTG